MHERQSPLVARGASPTRNSQHLTLHAVDLVALDGEVSWQWEGYFRVAAAMQAATHELEASGVLGRPLGLALGDRVPEDGSPKCMSACRATGWPETIPGRPAFRAVEGLPASSTGLRPRRGGGDRGRDLRD
jgi:hypothetical protein